MSFPQAERLILSFYNSKAKGKANSKAQRIQAKGKANSKARAKAKAAEGGPARETCHVPFFNFVRKSSK